MPDFNIEYARWCSSNEYWEKDIDGKYTVRFEATPGGQYQRDYTCTCPAFKYRPGYCKHIDAVMSEHCQYGWEASAGSPIEMGKECPSCGGETSVVRYAV